MARGQQHDWIYYSTLSHCATGGVGSRAPPRAGTCLRPPKAALPDALEGTRSPHPRRRGAGRHRQMVDRPCRSKLFSFYPVGTLLVVR